MWLNIPKMILIFALEASTTGLVANDEPLDTAEPHRWYAVIVGRQPGVFCGSYAFSSCCSHSARLLQNIAPMNH